MRAASVGDVNPPLSECGRVEGILRKAGLLKNSELKLHPFPRERRRTLFRTPVVAAGRGKKFQAGLYVAATAEAAALWLYAPGLAVKAEQVRSRREAEICGGPGVGAGGGGRGAGWGRPPGGRQAKGDVAQLQAAGGQVKELMGGLRQKRLK
jgi:hypothetical protein